MSLASFKSAIKRGASAVRTVYAQQQKAAHKRAAQKMRAAKTYYEKERIKSELEMEQLKLQKAMYDAQAAVLREKESVAKARQAARGGSSIGSLSRGLAKGWKALEGFYNGKPKAKRRAPARRATRAPAKRRK